MFRLSKLVAQVVLSISSLGIILHVCFCKTEEDIKYIIFTKTQEDITHIILIKVLRGV